MVQVCDTHSPSGMRNDAVQIQVRVGLSRMAGQGLFAVQDIPPGARIIAYMGEKISSHESARRRATGNAYIFHLNYRSAIDGQTLDNTARYINHSCDPNCAVAQTDGTLWIVARRDITAREELSFNYGYEMTHYQNNPCNCGAQNCCGYILDRQYWGRIPGAARASQLPARRNPHRWTDGGVSRPDGLS